jgi:beta-glucosidase
MDKLCQSNLSHFLWGASTSSYQVEGGITNNDWNCFTTSEDIRLRLYVMTKPNVFYKGVSQVELKPAGEAVKAWQPEYYAKDFELAAQIGLNSFRISLEWARIEPDRGNWNQQIIEHYKEMISSIREHGLVPIVTLNHLTLPLWVLTPPTRFTRRLGQSLLPSPLRDVPIGEPVSTDAYWKSLRGWENPETVNEFIAFVANVVQELKSQIDYWITFAEPVASIIGSGYIAGLWPPGFLLDGKRAKKVLHNLIEAHVLAYDKIKELDDVDSDGDGKTSLVGFSHAMTEVSPAISKRRIPKLSIKNNNVEASKNFAYFVNDYLINAVVNGEEDLNYLETLERYNKESTNFKIHKNWINKTDFIGVNYYRRVYVYYSNIVGLSSAKFIGGAFVNDLRSKNEQPHGILNDLGWEIYPKGLYNIITRITKEWNNVPIFVTENGIADKSDKFRAQFIISHLQQIRLALDKGSKVIGYLHWSFMDNYEWLDNYRPESKFGLFYIDRTQPNLPRIITKSAEAYKFIIQESFHENIDGIVTDLALLKAENRFGTFSPDGFNLYGQP